VSSTGSSLSTLTAAAPVVDDPAARPEARNDALAAFFGVEANCPMLAKLAAQVEGGQGRRWSAPLAARGGREAFAAKQAKKVQSPESPSLEVAR
jgi:hypothetical protein